MCFRKNHKALANKSAELGEIERNINMYRSVLTDVDTFEKEDKDYVKETQDSFFEHIKLYQHLMQ